MDADGEICSLQSFGSADAAKVYAQYRLPSFVTSERDSQGIILLTSAVFERESTNHPSPQSSPRKRGEAGETCRAGRFHLKSMIAAPDQKPASPFGKGRGLR